METIEFERKKQHASRLLEWLNKPENKQRSTWGVISKDYRKLKDEIDAEETERRVFNPNNLDHATI